jgi:uncharacterized protein (DUF2235 family)
MTAKRIILCLDGTWNSPFDEQKREDGTTVLRPSNVLKVARAVYPQAAGGTPQLVYYDIGVGSLAKYPGIANRILARSDSWLGGGFAAGFEGNVEDALTFLTMNFVPGDEVFIFGFSRGAATARAVTHFLKWSKGVPRKFDAYYLPRLFRAYVMARGAEEAFGAEVAEINREKTKLHPLVPVTITYLGVWDTVAALGSLAHLLRAKRVNAKRSFHIADAPASCVRTARHAIAVDEKRLDFPPEIWTRTSDPAQKMEQRWFAGVHSNVGGGYLKDGLANIAFHWILDGATGLGLEVDTQFTAFFPRLHSGTQNESLTRTYQTLEWVRRRKGKGVRELTGYPAAANLELDPSVIARMQEPSVPFKPGKKAAEVQRPYRPANVIRYLAAQNNLDAYLTSIGASGPLPPDVMADIAAIQAAQAVTPSHSRNGVDSRSGVTP